MRKQQGFTLVEIAIVLVIIGILLGGVLKGRELIENAKIANLAKSIEEIRAAVNAYQDRYRALPGDDKKVDKHIATLGSGDRGNGNGRIEGSWASKRTKDESRKIWKHLRAAGFLSGEGSEQPVHSYGNIIGVQWANIGTGYANVICLGYLTGDVARLVDIRLDDGVANIGLVRALGAKKDYVDTGTYHVCTKL